MDGGPARNEMQFLAKVLAEYFFVVQYF